MNKEDTFYYVETKKGNEKRYKRVIFYSEDLLKCYEFILNQDKDDKLYRIANSTTQITTTPMHGGTK